MSEVKRFQRQSLDSKDYEKVEKGAKLLKNSGKVVTAFVVVGGVLKKYGPEIIRGINKIRKG